MTEKPDYEDLARRYFEVYPEGANGWVSPDGTLLPNECTCHEEFCRAWFGQDEREVEKTHVKLSDGVAYCSVVRLTKKQENTLLDLGYDPERVGTIGSSSRHQDFSAKPEILAKVTFSLTKKAEAC